MASFEVRVVDDHQKPLAGQNVILVFTDVAGGLGHEERTDGDGIARFEGYEEGQIDVYVNGKRYGGYYYEDGQRIIISR